MTESRIIAGRYTVGPLIGVGGMGDVYQGYDTMTGDTVAIKFLKPEIVANSPSLVERFTREGEALRRLNHPSIVKMLAPIKENGVYCLVMEYVSGGSLKDLLDDGTALSVDRVVNIALDLADALTRAHRLNIIHRDIKPANVLLADDGTPRLTDFGVAYMGDRTRVTESGSLIGTYAYMSPEGCMGEELDERADIWSFGVMLYEMLARRRPFEGTAPAAVIAAIMQKPVPDLLQFRPDVPAALAGLIYAMLEKDRESRITSVRMVGTQLEALIKGSDTAIERMAIAFADPKHQPHTPPIVTPGADRDGAENEAGTLITPPPVTPLPTPAPLRSTQKSDPTQPFKRVVGGPRIFLSYRREDSIAVTGRLYDRLVDAYGEAYVFKDVDNIPAGANFRRILEDEISSADVLLVIIGDHWTTVSDAHGKRRLDDPDDFVRIEVAAGLSREDILVIPVLVNNATMPGVDHLPDVLHDLSFRNAAILRNDPDFNRDAQRLVDQISKNIMIVPPAPRRPITRRLAALGLLLSAVLLVGLGLLNASGVLRGGEDGAGAAASAVTPPPDDDPTTKTYAVLIADFEQTGGEVVDVGRFIARDLERNIGPDIPLSQIRIITYDEVIKSRDAALKAAEANRASVVVWGTYDDTLIEAEIQVGSLAEFPFVIETGITRDVLERSANVTVRLSDARQQSLASQVLGVLDMMQSADGDAFELMRLLAVQEQLAVQGPEITGNSVAARAHRFSERYVSSTAEGLADLDAAIAADASNPILYGWRAGAYQRLGEFEKAEQDLNTVDRLGLKDWAMSTYLRANSATLQGDIPLAIELYSRAIALRPDDWFGYNMRGAMYYLSGDYELAKADFESSFERKPTANFPYVLSAVLALREGRIEDARGYLNTITTVEMFSPSLASRLMESTFGSQNNDDFVFGPMLSALGNYVLKQYDAMLADTNTALAIDDQNSDLWVMKGFAECNLGQYAEAEASYTRAIKMTPDDPFGYVVRADVLLKQGKLPQALLDMTQARNLAAAQAIPNDIATYLDAGLQGQVGCENFFEWQPPE
jgi:serine/threonine protein kinase/tetratricopeptide (TPR) repeat protein